MASRRLDSARFCTRDVWPEVCSPAGLAWIRDNDMRMMLLRHSDNAFAPWDRAS